MSGRPERRPDVTVWCRTVDGGVQLRLTAADGSASLTVGLAAPDVLRACHHKFGRAIGAAADRCRTGRSLPVNAAADALSTMARAGRVFLSEALLDPEADLYRMSRFLRESCPTWRTRTPHTPLIHVLARSDQYFPWELVPLFDPVTRGRARDVAELAQVASAFTGFAVVVERSDPDRPVDDSTLDGWDRLPLRMMYDSRYPGAQQELGFFRGRGDLVRLRGPYPRDVGDETAPTVARQLCDPTLGVDGRPDGPLDQVVHFSCHCEGVGDGDRMPGYRLADEQGREVMLLLDDLVDELMRIWADPDSSPPPDRRPPMPLVFLNACGTAALDPATATSLLKPFAQNRNRGIIGTAANVPDGAAAAVSRWFYTNLLAHGMDVGQALHAAKWRLLQDWGNPLGLLYSVHAYAGLRVAPVPTYAVPVPGGDA
ncbi:CHAT domain-containing protein [Micromonospora rhizosphaerae]|uniref:CHAT domain-containing protein n=1 Tax=Micromonospora rhizosphaerae TaxID=568872 RepID=A0A1C6SKH9_9ACTN|nr:CHAT domain-containing protein [Micromonospora rhizosphaerae]SCL29912.1 CHAT domain-containing protein [Micromonospora rhizosphaerae]